MIRLPSSLREVVSTEAERRDVPVGALLREMVEKQITVEVMTEALLAQGRVKNEPALTTPDGHPVRWRRHA
jgi:hypothetical protein